MATFTPNYNLRKPDSTDDVEVSTDLNANYDIIDDRMKLTDNKVRTAASFPVAPLEGHMCYRSDQDKLYVYSGTAWLEIYPRSAYKARIRATNTQAIAASTPTTVTFDTNDYNVGMTVTLDSESITITQTGVYCIKGSVSWISDGTNGDGIFLVRILRNDVTIAYTAFNHVGLDATTVDLGQQVFYEGACNSGDVIILQVQHSSSVSNSLDAGRSLVVTEVQ